MGRKNTRRDNRKGGKGKANWRDAKRHLGKKLLLCRDCGRMVMMLVATMLEMEAKKERVACNGCGGKLFPV